MLLTGGDPLVMRTDLLAEYLEPLLDRAGSTSRRSGSERRPSRSGRTGCWTDRRPTACSGCLSG